MKSLYLVRAAGALALMTSLPGIAYAQAWVPGSEIVGQPVTVTTNGVSNTVYLDPGGSARIMTRSPACPFLTIGKNTADV